ncbi:MAG: FtsX-like permease family protein [Rickettsiales bacterium]
MRTDIAFSSDDSHRFLPWLIGIMVCLACLLLCFVISINSWINNQHNDYSNSLTVNIPVKVGETIPQEKIDEIAELLKKNPAINKVKRIEKDELQKMLVPWLGENMAQSELPLPIVLDVELYKNTDIDTEELQKNIDDIVEESEIDTKENWVKAFINFSSTIRLIMIIFASLIIVSIGLMISFTSRASLHLHNKAVRLLHSTGAEDKYITKQFQYEAFLLTMRGTIAGCFIIALVFWAIDYYITSLNNPAIPSLDMGTTHIKIIILFAISCGVVSLMSARISVMKQLKKML